MLIIVFVLRWYTNAIRVGSPFVLILIVLSFSEFLLFGPCNCEQAIFSQHQPVSRTHALRRGSSCCLELIHPGGIGRTGWAWLPARLHHLLQVNQKLRI